MILLQEIGIVCSVELQDGEKIGNGRKIMATLSEDGDSWMADGIKRRDFRSIKNGPEVPKRAGKRKKKDTKRWCRGKEGKEHKLVHFKKHQWWHVDKCSECGKELSHHWSNRWSKNYTGWHIDIAGKRCFFN